jgi:probable HAF family extracellular repeat protein
MNKRLGTSVAALLAAVALPGILAAKEHPAKHSHYTLIDLGTLGGPNSSFQGGAVVVNKKGVATGWADTPVLDPNLGIPVFHAFKWDKGTSTDLGALPEGTLSGSQAINASGVIAGFSTTSVVDPTSVVGAEFVATIWKTSGEIVDLGTLGGHFSITNAINDRGQVVGGATNTILDPDGFGLAVIDLPSPTQWHAALWQKGTIQDLGTLGDGTVSFASFVNERGQIAGVSTTNSTPTVFGIPTVHPFLWEAGRGIVDVGTLGGVYSWANGLNNRGQVVGFSTLTGDLTNHAFLWERGTIQDLGTLGGIQSAANSLNDRGEIVGEAWPVDDHIHAFLWKKGVMADLGTVLGCDDSNAFWINSRSQAVGASFGCDGSEDHAVLWEGGPPAIDLNSFVPPGSDLFLVEAVSINDRGEIAALGVLPSGDTRAVLLIPGRENDDAAEGPPAASPNVARAPLAPEKLAAFRARLANRNRGVGLRLPKLVN